MEMERHRIESRHLGGTVEGLSTDWKGGVRERMRLRMAPSGQACPGG